MLSIAVAKDRETGKVSVINTDERTKEVFEKGEGDGMDVLEFFPVGGTLGDFLSLVLYANRTDETDVSPFEEQLDALLTRVYHLRK